MAKHLIIFGHSPNGSPDPGTTSGSLKEAVEIRKLKPYLEKWGKESGHEFSFYEGDMYADRSISKQKGYDTVTELHLDGPKGSGGHVIIFREYKPDAIDKRLRDLIKSHWGIVGYLQNTDGFSYRSNLYNLNEAARLGINYRLLELFFMSNSAHRQYYLDNLDLIAKEIIESVTGEELVGKTESTPDVKPAPKPSKPKKKTAQQVAQEIADGKGGWGNDPQRSRRLKEQGYNAKDVQNRVNDIIRRREGVQTRPSPIKSRTKTLHLPRGASSWRVYKPGGPYVANGRGQLKTRLAPAKFGGLSYTIKGNPAPHVYLIDTKQLGRVAIYAHPNTGAKITG